MEHKWKDGLCPSCQEAMVEVYKTRRYIKYPTGTPGVYNLCAPWMGDFDDDDHPMKDGQLYMPGRRTCGHRDCVYQKHVVSAENGAAAMLQDRQLVSA